MSWLGVNLNESINNIKGQISHLTREILTDEDGPEGANTEVLISKRRLKELESSLAMYQEQIKSLNNYQTELEDRCKTSDYNNHLKISNLQRQMAEKEHELILYQEKFSGWNWDSSSLENESVAQTNSFYDEKIKQLEKQLQEERQRNEEFVVTLQKNKKAEHVASNFGVVDKNTTSQQRKSEELENELLCLREENSKLLRNNEEFRQNLVDLDAQHQLIVDELLKTKKNLTEELKITKEKLEHSKSEGNVHTESSSDISPSFSKANIEALENEIHLLKENNNSLQTQLNSFLSKEQEETEERNTAHSGEDIGQLKNNIETLKGECSFKNEKIESLSSEIIGLKLQLESSSSFRSDLEASKQAELEVRSECEVVKNKLSDSESILTSQISRIRDLESELSKGNENILKYEAVLEEKELSLNNLRSRLSRHEDVAKGALQDLKSQNCVLENKLKSLELEKQSLKSELEGKILQEESRSRMDKVFHDLLKSFGVESIEELPSTCSDLQSEVASLRCERDRLSQDFSSTSQELKDANEVIEGLELEKIELEKEAEDLRDQLEELQCGIRSPPDGSHGPRSLPTIEEEESPDIHSTSAMIKANHSQGKVTKTDNFEVGNLKVDMSGVQVQNKVLSRGQNQRIDSNSQRQSQRTDSDSQEHGQERHLLERIELLDSQVIALREARQNLEMELASANREKEALEHGLSSANSQLGNLSNLEIEASSLRSENVRLQNLLKENSKVQKQFVDVSTALENLRLQSSSTENEKNKLMKQIEDQNRIIEETQNRISVLETTLRESDHVSGVVANLKEELALKEVELDKVKGHVIYKDDQIDEFKYGLQLIGEVFGLESETDLRKIYVHIKQVYSNLILERDELKREVEEIKEANKELESKVQDNSTEEQNLKDFQDLKSSLEASSIQLVETEKEFQDLKSSFESTSNKLVETEKELEKYKELCGENYRVIEKSQSSDNNSDLVDRISNLHSENSLKEAKILELKSNIYSLNSKLSERESELLNLRSELIKFKEESKIGGDRLESEICSLQQKLNSKEREIDSLEGKIFNLETKSADLPQIPQYTEELESLKLEFQKLSSNLEASTKNACDLKTENEALKNEIAEYESEKERIIYASHQKHQESVTYYNEIQRLTGVFQQEKQRFDLEVQALSDRLQASENQRKTLEMEVDSLKSNIKESKERNINGDEVSKLLDESNRKDEELRKMSDDLRKLQETSDVILRERDHLRVANSSFNSQYEEKCKELNAVSEREKHLSQEVERLRQHLMEIEEQYTSEAVQSEQREGSLRQSLAKMHEKISNQSSFLTTANQKYVSQIEDMQEQLKEITQERDEARDQLLLSEENCAQHQEAVSRLQQVLQDFQKNQMKDISSATEREKRRVDSERQKNLELELELKNLKDKLLAAEENLSLVSNLKDDLFSKDDTIVALKSQVHAVQLAAKKNQDQVSLLQSLSESKVDKHLLRNLIVGYLATPSDKRHEVLRVVAQVLDFSPEERSRTGIDTSPGSWLTSISNFLAPPPSNVRVASKVDVLDHSSLSQAFIRFLEVESSPRIQAKLPAVEMAEEANKKAHHKAQRKVKAALSSISSQQVPSLSHLSQDSINQMDSKISTNSSIISNPLLQQPSSSFSSDSLPTLSTPSDINLQPPLQSSISEHADVAVPSSSVLPTSKFLSNLLSHSPDQSSLPINDSLLVNNDDKNKGNVEGSNNL